MNSSEQREFEYITPTVNEVQETVSLIKSNLDALEPHVPEHGAMEEGYREVVRLLSENSNAYDRISPSLKTDTGRAMAVLAVDYLNGECSRDMLLAFGSR